MLEDSDLQAITRLIDIRAIQTEERIISRLEESEDFIKTLFEEYKTQEAYRKG